MYSAAEVTKTAGVSKLLNPGPARCANTEQTPTEAAPLAGADMANSKSSRKCTRKATQRNGASAWADFEKFAATIEDEEVASSGRLVLFSLHAWIASLCKEIVCEEMVGLCRNPLPRSLRGVDVRPGPARVRAALHSQRARQVLL